MRSGQAIVKVILETGYLSDAEIVFFLYCLSLLADFVETSTGFAGTGATFIMSLDEENS